MKRNVLALTAAGAIALGGFVVVQAQPGPGGAGHRHGHAFGLKGITEKLDLTAEQQAKVQPILDQAKPQIAAIHQEAMQKMHTVNRKSASGHAERQETAERRNGGLISARSERLGKRR